MTDAFTPAPRPCWIAGAPEQGGEPIAVTHPYDGTEVAEVAVPDAAQVQRALDAAVAFVAEPGERRAALLDRLALGIAGRAEEIVETVTAESGKPWQWAEHEVSQAVSAVRAAAVAARGIDVPDHRLTGAGVPGVLTLRRRLPGGPVLIDVPAAEPFGTAATGVAAAVAAGVAAVLLPASATPLSASLLGELLSDVDVSAFSVLPGHTGLADERCTARIGVTQGFCTAVVTEGSDVDTAAALIARYGVACAGQSPLAVRQVLVSEALAEEFGTALRDAVGALATGSPHDPAVEVGPMVDDVAAEAAHGWVEKAVAGGASVLCGGTVEGATVAPTVLWHGAVPENPGPVLAVSTLDSNDDVLAALAGTSAGVFTTNAAAAAELGALAGIPVVVNAVPAALADEPAFAALTRSGPGAVPALLDAFTREQSTVFPQLRP